jgi:hypothetical protein
MHTGILVYDFEGNMISDGIHFNGIYGPDTSCYDTVYAYDEEEEEFVFKNAPIGSIVFYNGGVDIACVEDLDDRGDINLNGVVNEIADAVLFTNYFIYGTSVFTINEAGQTAATDVNADGKTLTVADLVYLIRVIVGDAQPYAKTVPGEYASVSLQGHEVNFDANTNIGAAALVFEGNVNLSLGEDAAGMELASNFDGQYTKAIIYSLNANTSFSSGQILEVEGEGTLISVEAANFYGGALKTDVSTLPTNFNLSQNYPNPFNPVTKINLELPVASNWSIEVFNINGQRVAQFSGASEAGIVTVEWNAENFGSGMYFYKAVAGDFSATKKMVLLK